MRRDRVALDADRFAIDLDLGQLLAQLSMRGDTLFDFQDTREDQGGRIANRTGGPVLREYSPDWALVDSAEVP